MEVALAFVIGALYAAGLYMMLRRSMVKLIAGLVLLGYASNLLIFTVSPADAGQAAAGRGGRAQRAGTLWPTRCHKR